MNAASSIQVIDIVNNSYPPAIIYRLGDSAPANIWFIGNINLLSIPKTAFFCSKICPGDAILKAMTKAQKWRDNGRCIISGFHSPVEKECLKILLRGNQPIIICPARSIEKMRISKEWTEGTESGRILIISPFDPTKHRLTVKQSEERNRLVAALADEAYFAYTSKGSKTEKLTNIISDWGLNLV
jgi:predicted Rossmann fold nucleotide-binding protein DprA/Smf involved in DNA uptake